MPKDDFVQVRMTPSMAMLAGNAPLRISNGRRSFTFNGTEPQKVEKSYEWNAWLSQQRTPGGDLRFEIVPPPADPTPAPAPATIRESEITT